jgi:dihydrolipoamide dehydrogenase
VAEELFDLVVLGAGNAIPVAMGAGRAGLRTALVEQGPLGGTCPNEGCIPSKLLLGYAASADGVRGAGRFHVRASLEGVDTESILRETFASTRPTDGELEKGLPPAVSLRRGRGVFVGDRTLEVGGARLRGERVVVATGSRPVPPTEPWLSGLPWWTSRDVFRMERAPRSITVVGGGYVAAEMAQFFHGVGTETTVVVRGNELLDREDAEARAVFEKGFTARIPTRLGTSLLGGRHEGGRFRLTLRDAGGRESLHESEALLFAIGRVPNADGAGLDRTGVRLDARGFVGVDDRLRTSAGGVWAMGDCTGRHAFTHTAAWEAEYLLRVLLEGETAPLDYGPVPHAVFTSPEVAAVGATEEELKKAGTPYLKAAVPYLAAAKGRALKEENGLCKILLAPDGRILGCHIVGHEAATLLHEILPVLRWRNHVSSLTGFITVHPSLSEVISLAAREGQEMVEAAARQASRRDAPRATGASPGTPAGPG